MSMTWFAINSYLGWQRDYARFESSIALKGLKVEQVNDNLEEIFISVITHSADQSQIIVVAAQKYFGNSFNGLVS
jgi:hypothetical protein